MLATVNRATTSGAVAHDPDPATRARRRHKVHGALKTVEHVGLVLLSDRHGAVVIVPAGIAS